MTSRLTDREHTRIEKFLRKYRAPCGSNAIGKKKEDCMTQEQHPHEVAGYVRSFTFSNGQVIASCKYPGCRWGIGHHDSDSLANKYFAKHCDNLAVDPESQDSETGFREAA
jgi:hypothetical protein